MRTGIIQSIDDKDASGVILDENDQEVLFSLYDLEASILPYDRVHFEILLTRYGLRATHISKTPG